MGVRPRTDAKKFKKSFQLQCTHKQTRRKSKPSRVPGGFFGARPVGSWLLVAVGFSSGLRCTLENRLYSMDPETYGPDFRGRGKGSESCRAGLTVGGGRGGRGGGGLAERKPPGSPFRGSVARCQFPWAGGFRLILGTDFFVVQIEQFQITLWGDTQSTDEIVKKKMSKKVMKRGLTSENRFSQLSNQGQDYPQIFWNEMKSKRSFYSANQIDPLMRCIMQRGKCSNVNSLTWWGLGSLLCFSADRWRYFAQFRFLLLNRLFTLRLIDWLIDWIITSARSFLNSFLFSFFSFLWSIFTVPWRWLLMTPEISIPFLIDALLRTVTDKFCMIPRNNRTDDVENLFVPVFPKNSFLGFDTDPSSSISWYLRVLGLLSYFAGAFHQVREAESSPRG